MIKIIKPGTLREVTCNNCGAVLQYDTTEDMKTENVKITEVESDITLGGLE